MAGNEDDYIRRLTQSVLQRDREAQAQREREAQEGKPAPPRPFDQTPLPIAAVPQTPQRPRTAGYGPQITPVPGAPLHTPVPTSGEGVWRREVPTRAASGHYLPGTIIRFDDGTLALYKNYVREKDYDLIFTLAPDGKVTASGVHVASYETRPIGRLPVSLLEQTISRQRWERDVIIFHLLEYQDCRLIPLPPDPRESSAFNARVSGSGDTRELLVRGRKLTINFSKNQSWEAVYLGRDELGSVVAHHTNNKWAAMHLDLARFRDSLSYGAMLPPEEIARMENEIAAAGGDI